MTTNMAPTMKSAALRVARMFIPTVKPPAIAVGQRAARDVFQRFTGSPCVRFVVMRKGSKSILTEGQAMNIRKTVREWLDTTPIADEVVCDTDSGSVPGVVFERDKLERAMARLMYKAYGAGKLERDRK